MISGIIYDLDDTMVNSDPLHARAWEELLSEYGYEFNKLPENLRANFIGMRVRDIIDEVADYLQLDVNREDLYKKRIQLFLEHIENDLEPMPGLIESLDRFRSAGYRLAVASSGAREYINLVLTRFDIQDYFKTVVTGDDVAIGKPHPGPRLSQADLIVNRLDDISIEIIRNIAAATRP